jgi:hypothetical protein
VIFIVNWDRLFSEDSLIVLVKDWRKDIEGTEVRSLSGALIFGCCWPGDGIGRRARFKLWWPLGRVGSSPTRATKRGQNKSQV